MFWVSLVCRLLGSSVHLAPVIDTSHGNELMRASDTPGRSTVHSDCLATATECCDSSLNFHLTFMSDCKDFHGCRDIGTAPPLRVQPCAWQVLHSVAFLDAGTCIWLTSCPACLPPGSPHTLLVHLTLTPNLALTGPYLKLYIYIYPRPPPKSSVVAHTCEASTEDGQETQGHSRDSPLSVKSIAALAGLELHS